jgi:hypothetical protein
MRHRNMPDVPISPNSNREKAGGRNQLVMPMADRPKLLDHYSVPAAVLTALMVLAYVRLFPTGQVLSNGHLSVHYNAWADGNLAYSDLLALYSSHHLFDHALPYVHVRIQYPVVTGMYMWLAAFAPGVKGYFFASSLGLLAAALITLRLLKDLCPSTYYWFAFSPLPFIYGLLNWDLLGIMFLVLGWWLFRHNRLAMAGMSVSLGTFTKLFPVIALPFIVTALLSQRRWQDLRKFIITFIATSAVVNLPFAISGFDNWRYFFTFNFDRYGPGSVLAALKIPIPPNAIWSLLILCVEIGVVGLSVRSVWRGGTPERGMAFSFGAFLLINKVYSPQYILWLLAIGILAEWPFWSFWSMAIGGTADYYNSFIFLHLRSSHSDSLGWYRNHIFHWGARIRYTSIITAIIGSATQQVSETRQGQLVVDFRTFRHP